MIALEWLTAATADPSNTEQSATERMPGTYHDAGKLTA